MRLKQLPVLICILLFSIPAVSANSADLPVLQIGHITDVHYGQSSGEAELRVPLFTSDMNSLDVDFIVCTGDMAFDQDSYPYRINETEYNMRLLGHLSLLYPVPINETEYRKRLLGDLLMPRSILITEKEYNSRLLGYLSLMKEFDGPVYHVFGNHDVLCQNKSASLQILNNKELDSYMPSNYYYFDYPESGYRFIVLDGQYNTNGADKKVGDISYSDAFFPSNELDWLEETLNDAKKKKLNVIIFNHQPIKYHQREGEEIDFDRIIEAKGARSVSGIIENSSTVQCLIQGHLHYTDTVIDEESGVYYLTSEACADEFTHSVIKIFEDHSIEVSGEINQKIDSPDDETCFRQVNK